MDIKNLGPVEAKEAIAAMETVEQLREAATSVEIPFSGNTGEETLRKKLMGYADSLAEEPKKVTTPVGPNLGSDVVSDIQVAPKKPAGPSIEELLEMDPKEVEDTVLRRKVIRAQALKLVRVRIKNLDPADAMLPAGLFTVVNKYTGKVSKVIPYGDEFYENGYHVPQILLNDLKSRKFAMRKEIKGTSFGVKKYKTTMVPKFSIEILPPLSEEERAALAQNQQASGRIG